MPLLLLQFFLVLFLVLLLLLPPGPLHILHIQSSVPLLQPIPYFVFLLSTTTTPWAIHSSDPCPTCLPCLTPGPAAAACYSFSRKLSFSFLDLRRPTSAVSSPSSPLPLLFFFSFPFTCSCQERPDPRHHQQRPATSDQRPIRNTQHHH